MTTLSQIIQDGCALVFLDADVNSEGKLPTGMAIGCNKKWYKVYFQVNDSNDFEYVNSYSVLQYAESDDFEEILMGGMRLAEIINNNQVSL